MFEVQIMLSSHVNWEDLYIYTWKVLLEYDQVSGEKMFTF